MLHEDMLTLYNIVPCDADKIYMKLECLSILDKLYSHDNLFLLETTFLF